MMWFLLLLLHTLAHFGPVNSADQNQGKIILRSKDNPCEGHVEAYYGKQKKKGYVGDKHWSTETEKVVCMSTHCGDSVGTSTNVYRPFGSQVWLNELKCNGNEKSLWECKGWPGPAVSFYKKPTVKKITCSDKITFKLEPHKCEGVVQYTIQSPAKNLTGHICQNEFQNKEGEILCKHLGCGGVKKILKSQLMHFEKSETMMELDCGDIDGVTHPWQCVKSPSPSCQMPVLIRCAEHERVQLRRNTSNACSGFLEKEENEEWKSSKDNKKNCSKLCQQMHCGTCSNFTTYDQGNHLTCSDEVKVVLMDKKSETKCYGEVKIKMNGSIKDVCGSDWGAEEAEMVCKELNCGNVISHQAVNTHSSKGILDYVECTGSESSLWHCSAKHHNMKCSSVPYVVCSGSVNVKLMDGPGKCAGRLEVQYMGEWKTAVSNEWRNEYSDIVCQQLKCGNSLTESDQFFKGTSSRLTLGCKSDTKISDISQCITDNKNLQDAKQINITCQEHNVYFLNGTEPCSGTVGIEYRNTTCWFPWSSQMMNDSFANTICQKLHCGKSRNVSSVPGRNKSHIPNESLHLCNQMQRSASGYIEAVQASNDSQTIVHVECQGIITVTLSRNCWGSVNILSGGNTGLVSEDAWTHNMSVKLCQELGCQDNTLPSILLLNEDDISFKSLHALKGDWKLSQFTLIDGKQSRQKPAYVVCKGSIKTRFKPSRDKCSGNVEVFYENIWLPVLKDALHKVETQNTICKELKCGVAVETIPYFGPLETSHVIKTLDCQKNSKSLANCENIQAVQAESNLKTSDLSGLKCSEWSSVTLEVEDSCKGEVVVYSAEGKSSKRSFVSYQNWTKNEGDRLCRDMNCGNFMSMSRTMLDPAEANFLWSFKCTPTEDSIWHCKNNQTAIHSQEDKLIIECEGEPKVELSETCKGLLKIDGKQVCHSGWDDNYSHRVCQQLNCGNAIFTKKISSDMTSSKKLYHVHCDEHNYLISQCKRVEGQCNTGSVYVSCVDGVSLNISETCGGVLTVKYQTDPEEVCQFNISDDLKNDLCQRLECGNFSKMRTMTRKTNTEIKLSCLDHYKDPRHCIKNEPCQNQLPDELICEGYKKPATPPQPTEPTSPVPIIVGVLIVLILVVLIVIFVRYCIKRRNRKSMVPPDMEEVDWDSGDYEDVDKSDEMGSFSRGRFRSDSEMERERDLESNRSYNYDDVDEVTEAQPLTPQGSMVRAAKDEDMQDGIDKPSDEGVTYEVEDSRENYDDIDASPENAKTTAEVHDGPKPASEGDAAAPKDQVQ